MNVFKAVSTFVAQYLFQREVFSIASAAVGKHFTVSNAFDFVDLSGRTTTDIHPNVIVVMKDGRWLPILLSSVPGTGVDKFHQATKLIIDAMKFNGYDAIQEQGIMGIKNGKVTVVNITNMATGA